jgi:hypothetical protein
LKTGPIDWHVWAAAAAVAVAGGMVSYQLFRRAPDPDEIERERRKHLNRVGRIVEGHVVELMEVEAPPAPSRGFARRRTTAVDGHRKLVCYSYSISGVSYETAQDVTTLQTGAGLAKLTAGQPASVKYDPSNPSNSILIADNWSGLR